MSEQIDDYKLTPRHVSITTEVLAFLNSIALMNGYDRSIYPQFFSIFNLFDMDIRNDEDKVYADERYPCTLMLAMQNSEKQDISCETHIRTMWRVVVKTPKSHEDILLRTVDVFLDIPINAYESLPDVKEAIVVDNETDISTISKVEDITEGVVRLSDLMDSDTLHDELQEFLTQQAITEEE